MTCEDKHCPKHGSLKVKGRIFSGTVTSDKMQKTVTVQWDRSVFLPKYERSMKAWTRVKAHNPSCINARNGDYVMIRECRPLAKTKNFVVLEVIGKKEILIPTYEQFTPKEPKKASEESESSI